MGCPDDNDLAGYAEGEPTHRAAIEAHLDGCSRCLETLACALGSAAPRGLARGAQLGRYMVLAPIGRGAMAAVYAAYDPVLDRKVALKVIDLDGEGAGETSLAEAKVLARLRHPNVVPVHDAGRDGERGYIAMELIDGEDVASWAERRGRSWREVAAVFAAAARGLHAAHQHDIVHRDVKPENLLVGRDGHVRVVDFGLARGRPGAPARSTAIALASTIAGTPAYMAPEVLAGAEANAASDQWSLCAALWEALLGKRPFEADTVHALRQAAEAGPPAPDARLPAFLVRVLRRGLDPRPGRRWSSLGALAHALEPPIARRARWLIPAVLALVAVAVFGVLRAGQEARCAGFENELAVAWSPARRAHVAARFAERNVDPAPFLARIDRHAARWLDARERVCRAGRDEPEEVRAVRAACLDRALVELHAGLSVVESSTDVDALDRAVVGFDAGDPARCHGPWTQLHAPPASAAERAYLRGLAEARALRMADRQEEARAALDALGPAPTATTRAEALLARAIGLTEPGRLDERIELLQRALAAAAAGDDRRAEVEIIAVWAWSLVDFQDRIDEALALVPFGEAALVRAGAPADAEQGWRTRLAAVLEAAGRPQEAVAAQRRAFALQERDSDDPVSRARARNALAHALADAGALAEARGLAAEGASMLAAALGEEHPYVVRARMDHAGILLMLGESAEAAAVFEKTLEGNTRGWPDQRRALALDNLGTARLDLGDAAGALAAARAALRLRIAVYGPENHHVAASLNNVGQALRSLGRDDEALDNYGRAAEMFEAQLGPAHFYRSRPLLASAGVRCARGELGAARALYDQVLDIVARARGTEHWQYGRDRAELGRCLRTAGRLGEARRELEAALAVSMDASAPADVPAFARLELAQVLLATGDDHERARELLAAAEPGFAGPGYEQERALIARLLAQLR